MIVMKFGGTSVENAAALRRLAAIVTRQRDAAPVVVVSAMGRTTNRLLSCAENAAGGRLAEAEAALDELAAEHVATARQVAVPHETTALLDELTGRFAAARETVIELARAGTLIPRLCDALAATGELASSAIVAATLRAADLPAVWVDVRPLMKTGDDFTRAPVSIMEAIGRLFAGLHPLAAAGQIPVTQGFIGSTYSGETTTLGRGGSDYSAAIIGAALDASEIQIWTDVDGVMTTDPRVLPQATRLETISFAEAAELAYFGAKVLHPSTLLPAMAHDIPVRVLNSRRPDGAGTTITRLASPPAGGVRAIAMKRDITVVKITSDRMLMAPGFLARLFEVFSRHNTSIDMVTTSEVSVSMTLDDTRQLEAIRTELQHLGDVTVEREQAIVCLVGDGLKDGLGLVARVFSAIRHLPVSLISHGASAINISFVVPATAVEAAVVALHAEFFTGQPEPAAKR